MRMKQKLHIPIPSAMNPLFVALLLVFAGCGGQEEPSVEKEDGIKLSDKEINLEVGGWKPLVESRATIFETQDDFLDDASSAKGGGNFTMHAYLRENGATFIGGARAWYFISNNDTKGRWRFYDAVNNRFVQYYWPNSNTVDFFAYMPYKDSGRQKNITVGDYKPGTGLNLTCEMKQPTDLEDAAGQETIIAYTADKSKADGSVNMLFVHPFAAVYFKLKQAHRNLTINWIRFNDVYLTGSTTLNATTTNSTLVEWTGSGSKGTFEIMVGKTIPTQINFGGDIGGPYLVMPQDLADATITINYTWDNAKAEDDKVAGDENTIPTDHIYQIKRTINAAWVVGNKYTYILDLGDNQEEILFKVEVTPWDVEGHKHIIDVE